jgi:4-hydroxybutyrate dehydrogenase
MGQIHEHSYLNPVSFGHGAVARLGALLSRRGLRHVLVCTDPGLARTDVLAQVLAGAAGQAEISIFDQTPGNPTEAAVEAAAAQYRRDGCDGLVAVGGGSPIDLAKAVSIAVSHSGPLAAYAAGAREGLRIGSTPPVIAVPTTAGTGSESSAGSVIILRDGSKAVFAAKPLIPVAAICDPDLTLGLPPFLTAVTGMDAVTHCIEAYLSPVINPPADAIALDGVARAIARGWLFKAVQDGSDREARWHMMMAAQEGVMAFVKPLGAAHAMSHACSLLPDLHLHHGLLNAITLPVVLRFNEPVCGDRLARLREAMGLADGADAASAIEDLNRALGLPARLSDLGVTGAMIPALVDHAIADFCHRTAARVPTAAQYASLFAELL